MTDLRAVSTSTEDYLEAILRLIAEKGAARVRDIAAALSVHKSTVSATLKTLSEKGLVKYSPYEIAILTPTGQEIAQNVSGRHEVIRRFLSEVLAVSDAAAETNACRMEHVLDAEALGAPCAVGRLRQGESRQGQPVGPGISALLQAASQTQECGTGSGPARRGTGEQAALANDSERNCENHVHSRSVEARTESQHRSGRQRRPDQTPNHRDGVRPRNVDRSRSDRAFGRSHRSEDQEATVSRSAKTRPPRSPWNCHDR